MPKLKKSQGLPINVIILAILALIVLVVLLAIFSKQSGKSINVFEDCKARGGECRSASSGCLADEIKMTIAECQQKTEVCCISINSEQKK